MLRGAAGRAPPVARRAAYVASVAACPEGRTERERGERQRQRERQRGRDSATTKYIHLERERENGEESERRE